MDLDRSRRRDDRRRSGAGRIPTKTADSMPTMTPGQTDAASSDDAVIQAVATFQIPEVLVWFPIAVLIYTRKYFAFPWLFRYFQSVFGRYNFNGDQYFTKLFFFFLGKSRLHRILKLAFAVSNSVSVIVSTYLFWNIANKRVYFASIYYNRLRTLKPNRIIW